MDYFKMGFEKIAMHEAVRNILVGGLFGGGVAAADMQRKKTVPPPTIKKVATLIKRQLRR